MAKRVARSSKDAGSSAISKVSDKRPERKAPARSVALAAKGFHTAAEFAGCMSAMMSDLLEERIEPGISNAVCNAGGKLLKVVEMEYKYGAKPGRKGSRRPRLMLASA